MSNVPPSAAGGAGLGLGAGEVEEDIILAVARIVASPFAALWEIEWLSGTVLPLARGAEDAVLCVSVHPDTHPIPQC